MVKFRISFTLCVKLLSLDLSPEAMAFKFPIPTPADHPEDIELDIYPLLRIFKDGKIERFLGTATVSAGTEPATGVQSKDVILSPEDEVGVRLYLPKDARREKKLPLVVYFHGGAFCANAVVASVNYRLAPEHPLPAAFEDSWRILKWASASHSEGSSLSPEPVAEPSLSEYVDFNKVFLAGDDAGGNIAHNMAVRAGKEGLPGAKLHGIILSHPYFSGVEPVENERDLPPESLAMHEKIWKLVHPGMLAVWDYPVISWVKEDLSKAREEEEEVDQYGRLLASTAWINAMQDRRVGYGEVMRRRGKVPVMEIEAFRSVGMEHVFHLFDPDCEEAKEMMKMVVEFINNSGQSADL
uniref:Alpha/beta hydrolase fold-3 domain-containing protein n=1 Tax=Kalanchoe fedtschenkoi TaxID=63787 RepID=A0A7N0ZRG6_KALFE